MNIGNGRIKLFGLKKCKEEDFYKVITKMGHGSRADEIDEYIMAIGIINSFLLAFGYFIIYQFDKELAHIFGLSAMILGIIDVSVFMIGKIEKKKYIFKFQKSLIVLLIINWMVLSLSFYIMPLSVSYYQSMPNVFIIVITIISIGFIYLIFNTLRLIYLTYRGKMRYDSGYCYERYIDNRLLCIALLIPGTAGVRGGRRFAKAMNEMGNSIATLIVITATGLFAQILFFALISEAILILYCKYKYKSLNDSYEMHIAGPKKRKKLLKQEKERERLTMIELKKKSNCEKKH